ncbi:MAG TPA: protein translocase subunit SecD [Pyrinomonadaceae bacterium]|jgi:preprotein translocase subunit SecD|nr:protein translocase subunit SecD [Pyrinomonadaceae bacterium]
MKNTGLWIRTAIIIAITLAGTYLVFGPRRVPTAADFTWAGIKNNLSENINLGLDLKGGSHLVMRVRTDEYLKALTENNAQAALTAAQDAKLPVTANSTVAENGNYSVSLTLSDPSQAQAVVDEVKKKVDFSQWGDPNISGGTITWSLPNQAQNVMKDQAVEQALKIIESRINAFGVKEPTLQRQGSKTSGQILLQMPGVDDPERVKKLIGAESHLMLMKVAEGSYDFPTKEAAIASLGGTIPPTRKVLPLTERDENANTTPQNQPPTRWMVLEYPPIVDGSELRDASAYSRTGSQSDYQISFSLKPAGAQKFGEWTGKNIGKYLAIVLNDEVKSAPVIKGQIFDQGTIEGRFTKTSAEDLALTLKSGALPAKIDYQEERTVGPSLGADSIRAGVEASVGGLALVILFMLFYYRGSGVNAVVALVLNMILTVAALIVIKSTLTLPGIAGLILGIGMAVDSNVLIFERIREELRLGISIPESIHIGFDRAFVTIIDTHITTIISSLILYMNGSGPIRGFAVTLILGLLINLFTAVFVSRTIFNWELSLRPNMKHLSI